MHGSWLPRNRLMNELRRDQTSHSDLPSKQVVTHTRHKTYPTCRIQSSHCHRRSHSPTKAKRPSRAHGKLIICLIGLRVKSSRFPKRSTFTRNIACVLPTFFSSLFFCGFANQLPRQSTRITLNPAILLNFLKKKKTN